MDKIELAKPIIIAGERCSDFFYPAAMTCAAVELYDLPQAQSTS